MKEYQVARMGVLFKRGFDFLNHINDPNPTPNIDPEAILPVEDASRARFRDRRDFFTIMVEWHGRRATLVPSPDISLVVMP